MNKETIKKILAYAGIILLFLVIAYSFVPQVLDNKIVNQSDIASWKGMANEAMTYNAEHPEDPTAWTNSMFGGMPTTATIDEFEGDWTQQIYKFLLTGRRPATYLFLALLGGFLLMLSLGVDRILAIAGAVAIAFCSYNMQIIQVGHNTKMQAIAYFPWVLAAVIFTYRSALRKLAENEGWKKWMPRTVLGATLFGLALSMQIKANHIQITYYLAIVIFTYALVSFLDLCFNKEKRAKIGRFFAASALLLVIGIVGIATNSNKLIPTYEYSAYTMRGGSELTSDSKTHNSKGLDLEYATAWSYGIEEMPNLLIPNFNGGSSSGPLGMDSETGKLLKKYGQPDLKATLKQMPLYWGPQPFTAGPMYLGAISIFLFFLGVFLVKGREKWWIIISSLIAIMLAWGNHFMWFTRLWFDYAPFYNKFRTVSMALTVLQVTVPALGFYVLSRISREKYSSTKIISSCVIAFVLTGGFCLLSALVPGIAGNFVSGSDGRYEDIIIKTLIADRQDLLSKDAWRSFWLITATFGLLMWALRKSKSEKGVFSRKGKMAITSIIIALLVLIDLFSVGKRYLNNDHFVTREDFSAQYEPRPVDLLIFEDMEPNYRVLDLSINTFNSSIPSYHHKTIGGYSPVKLQRYQDLIDRYITDEIHATYDVINRSATISDVTENLPYLQTLSMLNGKYIILREDFPPVENKHAFGNCWFVEDYYPAENPDEEIEMIGMFDLSYNAVIGNDFKWAQEAMDGISVPFNENDYIFLTHYAPNELRYEFNTQSERAAIFSEIYYPKGWKAWIEPAGTYGEVVDGRYQPTKEAKSIDLFRANWMLRGAIIPKGEGQLIMRFEPESYRIGANISRGCSITLIILLLISVAGMISFACCHKNNKHN